jgi:hypothetical protein
VAEGVVRRDPRRAQSLRRLIAWYELIGGMAGLATTLGVGIRYGMSLHSAAVLLTPFGLAAVAGATLVIDNERDALSIVVQLPQVLFWSIGRSVWQFCAGLYVPIIVVDSHLRLFFGADLSMTAEYSNSIQPFIAGINLVPLAVIGTLIWSRRETNPGGRAVQASPSDHTVNDIRIRIEGEYRDRAVIRGGILMFGTEDALGMVARARELGVGILGIDVFHLTPSTTRPDLVLDLSLSPRDADRAKSWDVAARFLRSHSGPDLYFEVVLDRGSGTGRA